MEQGSMLREHQSWNSVVFFPLCPVILLQLACAGEAQLVSSAEISLMCLSLPPVLYCFLVRYLVIQRVCRLWKPTSDSMSVSEALLQNWQSLQL